MATLANFKIYTVTTGLPALTLTKNGIGLSASVLTRLEYAQNVQILFDSDSRMMAIKKCEPNDEGAVPFCDNLKRKSVRWNNKQLCRKVEKLAQFPADPGFKVEGTVDEEECFVLFDMKLAKPIA